MPKQIPLDTKFFDFHAKHPHVYDLFRRIAREKKALNPIYISADDVGHEIRKRSNMMTSDTKPMKFDNSFTSRYARLLEQEDVKFKGLFRSRKLKTVSIL